MLLSSQYDPSEWTGNRLQGRSNQGMAERNMVTRREFVLGSAGGAMLVTMLGRERALQALAQDGPLKAAWVYVGPVSDDGWTAAHDEGRKVVVEKFGDKIETSYAESVPETPADAERV